MRYVGIIHNSYLKYDRYISVKIKNKVVYLYLQNNLLKKFKKYLYKGRFVSFEYDLDNYKIINKRKCYLINYFIYIRQTKRYNNDIYYDIEIIRDGIKNLISNLDNKMFLDLEMSMSDYDMPNNFTPELLQAGFIIIDKNNKIVEKKTYRVKPTKFPLSRRTKNFLNLWDKDQSDWVSYKTFYSEFKKIILKYNPSILVWGKNDSLFLKQSYELNKVESLEKYCNFINLLQLVKNYFNLKNEIGLFKALNFFTNQSIAKQMHDALEDAIVTYKVFEGFKDVIFSNKIN